MDKLRQNGCWPRVFCTILILVSGCGGQFERHAPQGTAESIDNPKSQATRNQQQISENKSETILKPDSVLDSLWQDLWTLPETIVAESTEIAGDRNKLIPLLLAGGASVALHQTNADQEVANNFKHHGFLHRDVDKIIDFVGGPGFHFAASGLWYVAAGSTGDDFNKARAWTMLEALSITGATTLGLKLIRHNRTPNDKPLAWPSGHTSSSFTVAAVLDELYGPEVGVPAYLGASLVGYRMMESGDHWASDVLFGAVLGYIVGHHVAGKHMELELAGFEVIPYTDIVNDKTMVGVSLVKRF